MVCFNPPSIESVWITDAVSKLRTVEPDSSAVRAARALGISFGDAKPKGSPFALSRSAEQRTRASDTPKSASPAAIVSG